VRNSRTLACIDAGRIFLMVVSATTDDFSDLFGFSDFSLRHNVRGYDGQK